MLRAIVQSAVASAASGRSFAGKFRRCMISATRLQVNDQGVAQVEASIVYGVGTVFEIRWGIVLAAREERYAVNPN